MAIERLRSAFKTEAIETTKDFSRIAFTAGSVLAVLGAAYQDWETASFGVVLFGIGLTIEAAKGVRRRLKSDYVSDKDEEPVKKLEVIDRIQQIGITAGIASAVHGGFTENVVTWGAGWGALIISSAGIDNAREVAKGVREYRLKKA